MTDSTGTLSETHSSSSSNEATETQLADAGKLEVTEPAIGTTTQVIAAGEAMQLNFDPADVAKVEVKDGNLEITFKNGAVAVIQGYEAWAAEGGHPTGPQGGAVDVAQLGQPAAAPAACELPDKTAHVVDVPVPAQGEHLTLALQPGDALRLACSFRDVHGTEAGNNLEMTFPGGGVVEIENFAAWIAAKGSTISDCVCGGVNPADFIVALGLNPEDVLPAAGGQGQQGAANHPTFEPGPGPEILHSLAHPHILPGTGLTYGVPNPEVGLKPVEDNNLGGPLARDDNPNAELNLLTVHETTDPVQLFTALAAASGGGEGGEDGGDEGCVGPIGPQVFHPDQTTIQVLNNDSFGPDGGGNPPITAFHYTGNPSLVDNPNGVLVLDPINGDKLVITSTDPNPNENQWHAELIIDGPNAGKFTFFLDSTYLHDPIQGQNDAFQHFSYTIQDSDGDKSSANITVDIVDSVPVANNDCAVCITEGGEGGTIPVGDILSLAASTVSGNVMDNDDKGADQFLPNGTKLITFTYTGDDGEGHPVSLTANAGSTVETFLGGHLTVNADGSWTYAPPAEVDNSNGDPHDDFTYTIQDGDGDTSSATQPICIQDNVEPPQVTMTIAGDATGSCVQEDSKTSDAPNQVTVHADAQGDDHLTQLVITGFTQKPDWVFDFNGMTQPGVTGVAYDPATGTLTVSFGPGVQHFTGTFGVQPPADSDVDLGTLTATATAAAADDPSKTLDNNTNLDVTVDANADPVHVDLVITDAGHDGSFSPNETGTAHVHADFGDFKDGSETHTVTVDIGDGFTVKDAAGGTITTDADGKEHVTFSVPTGTGSLDVDIGIQADKDIAQGGDHTFKVTGTATETTTGDEECDTSPADNIATATKETSPPVADDHPTAFDNKQCVNEGASQNVMIIADVSGSMDDTDIDPVTPGFQTRLQLEKDALTSLVNQYAALDGTVTVTLIAFASGGAGAQNIPGGTDDDGARNLGTFTFDTTSDAGYAAAIAAISSLEIGMQGLHTETEYDDALILAQQVLGAQLPGQAAGTTNTVYFLSDGVPNPLSNGADATTWKPFVNANNIEVVAVGIGAGASTTELDKVEDHNDKSVVIADTGDLSGLLTNTAGNSQVSGNVLTDPTEEAGISPANDPVGSVDKFGNDGPGSPKIVDLKVDGVDYNEGSAKGGAVLDNDGTTITVETKLGGVLHFNFETGDYTYVAPDHVQHGAPGSPTDDEVDERFTYVIQDSDGDTDPADLVICIKDGVPTAADDVNTVQESALDMNQTGNDLAPGLVTGSNPASTAETVTGNLFANDTQGPDGASITAIGGVSAIIGGFITVDTGHSILKVDVTTGDYTYTLTNKTSGDAVKDVFNYTLTDGDGDQANAKLTVNIVDDTPTARNDTDSTSAGHTETGNVITGDGTAGGLGGAGADTPGADGVVVTGIVAGTPGGNVSGGVDSPIAGSKGTLTLHGDGSYSYVANPNVTGTDVFTYTITDGDGDKSTATLTINVGDSTPSVSPATDEVHEASLDTNKDGLDLVAGKVTGSNPADTDETETGKLNFSDPDGASITKISFNGSDTAAVAGFVDIDTGHGKLHVNAATGDYVYTLYDKTSGDNVHDDFTYTVKDTLGNANSSTLVISIVDDVPTARNDADSTTSGHATDGNVITGAGTTGGLGGAGTDTPGADGAVVTGIVAGTPGGNVSGGVDSAIAGSKGTLTLHGDGSYTYTANANVTGTDVFTYTITDGDGDKSTATLTINVGDSTPSVSPATDEVHEASLDTNKDGLDLVAGKVTGSNPADTDETETGKLNFSDPDGASITKISFNGSDTAAVAGFVDIDTGHGKLHVNAATGDYVYTLYDKTSGDNVHDDFTYTVKDTLGNANSSTLVISIVDDVPTARNDADSTTSGHATDGNVITGAGTTGGIGGAGADTPGADGAVVTGIVAGTPGGNVSGGVDSAIAGSKGTLTLHGDGSYTYTPNANATGTDVFTYTLTDGDGDKSTATLTINVGDSAPSVSPATDEVHEASLDLNKDGLDLVAGKVTGSNPADTDETETGKLNFSDPDGASITKISFNGSDTSAVGGFVDIDTGHGKLHVNASTGDYTYTLYDKTAGDNVHDDFTYTVKDTVGNTNSSTLTVNIVDDVPHATADTKSTADTVTQNVNLVIVFDRSGSMNDDPNVPGYSSRLELAKAAVAALFEAYDSVTNQLHIKIVDFSDTANNSTWLNSPEDANAYLAALEAGGTTNYAGPGGAIPELMNNYSTHDGNPDPVPAADRTEVYFISDGKPNPTTTTLDGAATSTTVTAWENFLTTNHVENAFAIGVGAGLDANDADLGKVAFPPHGNDASEPNRILVTDESQLLATLVGTVASSPISGNVVTDSVADTFGADGKGNGGVGLQSIAFNGHTYTFNQATNEIRNEANVLVTAGAVLSLDTTLGGHIEFHFDTGAYTYTPPNVDSPQTDTFLYTIVDGDGDTSSATLTVNISDAGGNVVTPHTHIGTDGADNLDDSALSVDNIISGGGGNDTVAGGSGNDHIQGGNGDDNLAGNGGIDIMIGGAGNDSIAGGAGNDTLFGNDGNDTLDGGPGADLLDAGNGNNKLFVGTGDSAVAGNGNDLFVLQDNVNFGHIDGGLAPSADLSGATTRGDVLAFNGTLDLTSLANTKIEGIETISMKDSEGGAGNDTLTLNAQDVIDLGTGHFDPGNSGGSLSDHDAIKVDGEAGDTLNLTGGNWSAQTPSPNNVPAGYTLYVHDTGGSNEDAYVLVQTAVTVHTS